ncbi:MAG TPA: peptidylprolyl isomerase [Bryobacteraceae bacterium]|jgi:peptidyl-prolyl cis-trans isomerase D|nr:peptidylprolyl isomerase [Bryobacteraceae bacterium]
MFDLFRSSQKGKKILLSVVLGVVALSMLLYLIPGAGTPTSSGANDQIVAEIGPETVTVRQVEQGIRVAFRGSQISPQVAAAIVPQIAEQVISDRALAYAAKQLGFEVTDGELAAQIRSNPQVAALTPQQYQMFIEQQLNLTVPEYEGNLRLGLLSQNIQNMAMEGAFVSPAEVEAEYRRRNEMAKVDYIAFDPAMLASQVKATPEELQPYFEKNRGFFTAPESRNVQLIVADQVKVGESIQVTDTQVQSYYNSHKDQFRTKERVKARHILVSILNKPADQVPKLKTKAEDLLKQIKAGADFAKMAQENSDDKSNASKGGDLGWVMRGQMVPEFEKATFALKQGQISDVVTTNYGFHIVQVMEKEDAHLRPLDDVRSEVVTAIKSQSLNDRMQALVDQAHTELVKAPQNAQQIANKLGLLFVKVDNLKAGDTVPELGGDVQVGGAITSMQAGAISQVMQSGEKLAIAIVTKVNPPHPADFAEAGARVRTRYSQERGVALATEKANKAAEIAKANGGDLKAAAKAVGLEVKSSTPFNRTGAVEGLGDARYLGDSFDKPVGTVIGPLNVGTQTVLVKIVERSTADLSKMGQERETIVKQLKEKKSRERFELVRDSVVDYLSQKGKVKIHKNVLDRLQDRYRT